MKRALELIAKFRADPTADHVHDLRVSFRHCRSIAATMQEIDPHRDWEDMRRFARKLFRALGELRETQVTTEWLNQLHPGPEELKDQILHALSATEKTTEEKALHRAARFDEQYWKKRMTSLRARMRRVPVDGDAAHCLALERLEEARELHRRAMRTESAKPWHGLRIGIKRFRYTVDCLLPAAHVEWKESLKRVQDVLGNIHDLHVLSETVKRARTQQRGETDHDWETRIESELQVNRQTYRQLTLGTTSIWTTWMSEFPRASWERYANARIRATRASMEARPGRSIVVARLAMRLWSQLRMRKVHQVFSDKKERRVLDAAARLIAIDAPRTKNSQEKAARTFLLKSPVPPRWTFAEWERVAWAIRFQRGPGPELQHKRFSKLTAEQQARISLLAGILRLAIAMQKCGVTGARSIQLESLPQALLLHVAGVQDSPKNAARFTRAKLLLERSLGKTILIQPEPEERLVTTRTQAIEPPTLISAGR
jgi:CHAD domain-containing protein